MKISVQKYKILTENCVFLPKISSMLQIKTLVFNQFCENTYLVFDETKDCVIIDPGCSCTPEVKQLCRYIDDNQLNIKMIINTHGHIDHVVGNTALVEKYGVAVAAGTDAKDDFTEARRQAKLIGFPLNDLVNPPDKTLEEGDIIPVGNGSLEVIATPGHAKGSISLYAEMEDVVFTGDALFCRSIGRTDLMGGDYEELCRSIKEKLFRLPADTTVLSGHGEATTIGEERDFNLYVNG